MTVHSDMNDPNPAVRRFADQDSGFDWDAASHRRVDLELPAIALDDMIVADDARRLEAENIRISAMPAIAREVMVHRTPRRDGEPGIVLGQIGVLDVSVCGVAIPDVL